MEEIVKGNKDHFAYLGSSFQLDLTKILIEDEPYFINIIDIVDPNFFSHINCRKVVGTLKNYYEKYLTHCDYKLLETEIKANLQDDEIDGGIYTKFIESLKSRVVKGVDSVKDHALDFFKQQKMVKAINEILGIIKKGDFDSYDSCRNILEQAIDSGSRIDIGERLFDNFGDIINGSTSVAIPTGILALDNILEGGLTPGELGVIICPTGLGKVQPLTAYVLADGEFVPMSKIVVGSRVCGRDGQLHNVTAVYPHKNWVFYKVTFSDGAFTRCGEEHLWSVIENSKEKVYSLKEIEGKLQDGIPLYLPDIEPIQAPDKCYRFLYFETITVQDDNGDERIFSSGDSIPTDEFLFGNIEKVFRFKEIDLGYFLGLVRPLGIFPRIIRHGAEISVRLLYDKYGCLIREKRRFVSVTYCGRENGQCITVDDPNGNYLTDDYILTHNTSMTTNIAAFNVMEGRNVIQIFFEDMPESIKKKHFAYITNIESRNLLKDGNKEKLEELADNKNLVDNYNKHLILKKFPDGEISPSGLETYLKRVINSGFRPDLVIIDYPDCMIPDVKNKDIYQGQEEVIRGIINLADKFRVPIWAPLQGTKESINAEIVGIADAGGSFGRVKKPHVVISITRSDDDVANNKAKITVGKNRNGLAHITLDNVYFNNGTCQISSIAKPSKEVESYIQKKDIERNRDALSKYLGDD